MREIAIVVGRVRPRRASERRARPLGIRGKRRVHRASAGVDDLNTRDAPADIAVPCPAVD